MEKLSKGPFIKWSGSKRFQAKTIVDNFPAKIDTYYECFLGGGSVLFELLTRIIDGSIECKRIVCSDVNKDLISIFNILKNDRQSLFDYYCDMRNRLIERSGYVEGVDAEFNSEHVKKGQTLYYENRERYNKMDPNDPEKPYLFYWISRTSFNGLIRFNPKGEFNAPFHVGGRTGISPDKLQEVFDSWGYAIDYMGDRIEFINDTFDNVIKDAKEGDVIYMDPPYEKAGGMYFCNTFDKYVMFDMIRKVTKQGAKVLLSYDGISGNDDRTIDIPTDLYKRHIYVKSARSSFKLLKSNSAGQSKTDDVSDSLYISY